MYLVFLAVLACGADKGDADTSGFVDLADTGWSDGELDADADADTDTDSDSDSDAPDTGDTDIEPDTDGDLDGWTPAEGDCDDGDSSVNPGVTYDECDGVDNDCDGQSDEDFNGDEYEPNDVEATDLGDLSEAEDEGFIVSGYISPSHDIDVYRFYVYDGWLDWFDIEATLSDVPSDADYALELVWVADADDEAHGTVDDADDGGLGEGEFINYGGGWSDNSGYYEIVVYSKDGQGCDSAYRLQIVTAGFR